MVTGVALDFRAHAGGRSFEEEGFVTPEHAFFYSMFLGIAAVLFAATYRNCRACATRVSAVPDGYGWAAVGVLPFGVAGVADFGWHSGFGFEEGVEGADQLEPSLAGDRCRPLPVVAASRRVASGDRHRRRRTPAGGRLDGTDALDPRAVQPLREPPRAGVRRQRGVRRDEPRAGGAAFFSAILVGASLAAIILFWARPRPPRRPAPRGRCRRGARGTTRRTVRGRRRRGRPCPPARARRWRAC